MSTGIRDALDGIAGPELYRDNLFRRSGLPVTAGAVQIRRRREEAKLRARLTPAASGARPSARDEEPADAGLDAAVSALRDPLVRIVHETFWLWCEDESCERSDHALEHRHDAAVRAHRAAVEDGWPDPGAEDTAYEQALAQWAEVCDGDGLEGRLRRRAAELDDPRLNDDGVDELCRALPGHLLGVNAGLAAAAARPDGDATTAQRHVAIVRGSAFGEAAGAAALRRVTADPDRRIHADCATAERAAKAAPADAPAVAGTLLDDVGPDLHAVRTLLGPDDGVTRALGDLVAVTVNVSCVLYLDRAAGEGETADPAPVVPLLRRARELTTETTTLENINANIGFSEQRLTSSRVEEMCRAGRVDRAADALWLWRLRTSDEATRRMLTEVLADPRALHAPITSAPSQGSFYIGVHIYGRRSPDASNWIQTQYLTLLGIPLLPLGSYVADGQYVYARVPLGPAARWVRRAAPVVPLYVVVGGLLTSAGMPWVLALLLVVLAVALVQVAFLVPLWFQVGQWIAAGEGAFTGATRQER